MSIESFHDGRVVLHKGDCLDSLRALPSNSVDSVVTDPPYALVSIARRYGKDGAAPAKVGATGAYARASAGFMGKSWDTGERAFAVEFWAEVFRVLKPGGHVLAFSATRTVHRLTCAIEDAGFEIRDAIGYAHDSNSERGHFERSLNDEQFRQYSKIFCDTGAGQLAWSYASGFPKSHNITRALAGKACACGASEQAAADQDVFGVRQGVGAENALSGQECDVFAGVRGQDHLGTEARHGEEAAARLCDMWGRGEGSAAVEATEALGRSAVLQPPVLGGDASGAHALDHASVDRRPNAGELRGPCEAGFGKPGLEGWGDLSQAARELRVGPLCALSGPSDLDGEGGRLRDGAPLGDGGVGRSPSASGGVCASPGPRSAEQPAVQPGALAGQPKPQAGGAWPDCARCGKPIVPDGLGTALKPAWEPIAVGRKPLAGTVAENVLAYGPGALNIDACRVEMSDADRAVIDAMGGYGKAGWSGAERNALGDSLADKVEDGRAHDLGRWPANIVTDGSDEVVAAFPETGKPSVRKPIGADAAYVPNGKNEVWGSGMGGGYHPGFNDAGGSAARFFFSAKADGDDRIGSKHPTVKPVDLMRWCVRLVTPPGGTVLDCFAGTGTTGEAAFREGMRAILCEREPEYQADIARRMALILAGPAGRRAASAKARDRKPKPSPLFGEDEGRP